MAVIFTNDSFTIVTHTGTNPAEDWLETAGELIDVLQSRDNELSNGTPTKVLQLLRNMMPDLETAKRMTSKIAVFSLVNSYLL